MGSWVLAVEVTPSELVAVDVDRGTGSTPRTEPLGSGAGTDPVDALADAFDRVLAGAGTDRPHRLVVATPPDTERRRFEEIAEATALVGLPAPSWLPGPVALVGDRIASEVGIGGRAVVLDGRDGGLTAWPVLRTARGAEVGARGPVATGTRLDQLLLGVVRAQMRSLDPAAADGGPRPGARVTGSDPRGEAARLRREVRRTRARLSSEDVAEVPVTTGGPTVSVDRAVFDQLVEHALRETTSELEAGTDAAAGPPVVHVLVDGPSPLAHRLVALTAGTAPVLAAGTHDAVLGLVALLRPPRPRPTRAASGAQAIRARRVVATPSAPVAVGARPSEDAAPPLDPPTPPHGLARPDPEAPDPGEAVIPAARIPSTPVQAQRHTDHDTLTAFGRGASGEDTGGHAVLAAVAPHEVRPVSDAPPGGGHPTRRPVPDDRPRATPDDLPRTGPAPVVRTGRRGPDTAPQPVQAAAPAGAAPTGVVALLALLVVVAVLAAVGVLVLGPAQIGAAFGGLGAGVGGW